MSKYWDIWEVFRTIPSRGLRGVFGNLHLNFRKYSFPRLLAAFTCKRTEMSPFLLRVNGLLDPDSRWATICLNQLDAAPKMLFLLFSMSDL